MRLSWLFIRCDMQKYECMDNGDCMLMPNGLAPMCNCHMLAPIKVAPPRLACMLHLNLAWRMHGSACLVTRSARKTW